MNITENIKKIYYKLYTNVQSIDGDWNIIQCDDIISDRFFETVDLDPYLNKRFIIINSNDWSANTFFSVILLKMNQKFVNCNIVRSNNISVFGDKNIFINTGNEHDIDKDKYNSELQKVYYTYGKKHTTILSNVGIIWKKYHFNILSYILDTIKLKYKIPVNKDHFTEIADKIYSGYIKIFDAHQTGILNILSSTRDQKVKENIELSNLIINKIENVSPIQFTKKNNSSWYRKYKLLTNNFIHFVLHILKFYNLDIIQSNRKKFNNSLKKIPIDFSQSIPKDLPNVLVLKENISISYLVKGYNSNESCSRLIKIVIYPNEFGEYILQLYFPYSLPVNYTNMFKHIKIYRCDNLLKTNNLENALIIARFILEDGS